MLAILMQKYVKLSGIIVSFLNISNWKLKTILMRKKRLRRYFWEGFYWTLNIKNRNINTWIRIQQVE